MITGQINGHWPQKMGAAIRHQRAMNWPIDQCRYGRMANRLAHAANGIDTILTPQVSNCFGLSAVRQRAISGDQVADRLAVLQRLQAVV